jgi:tRNA-5-taurinomethyluridine 2-sulfurtransferase
MKKRSKAVGTVYQRCFLPVLRGGFWLFLSSCFRAQAFVRYVPPQQTKGLLPISFPVVTPLWASHSFWDNAVTNILLPIDRNLMKDEIPYVSTSQQGSTVSFNSSLAETISTKSAMSSHQWHMALVRQGLRWESLPFLPKGSSQAADGTPLLASRVARVPGCIATVHLQTVLRTTTTAGAWQVHSLRGMADAHIPRGLLAGLAAYVPQCTIADLLEPYENELAVGRTRRAFLSPGRNDGFANMIRTMQGQIQECLQQVDTGNRSRNTTSSLASKSFHDQNATEATVDTIPPSKPRVALLLSGGVDSSVALHRLVREGRYQVTAFYLKIWLEDTISELYECPWEEDYQYCQAVCQQLNVPLETISLQEEYRQQILSYTLQEAQQGRTPNPDILCNRRIKFGCFWDVIADRDFDHVATGHYAQVVRSDDPAATMQLHRAPDPIKDQSYFLAALTPEQLQRVLFPIGHLTKAQVRQYAEEYALPNRFRPDSQGLCFLGKVKFADFLHSYLADVPGPILDAATGAVLGQHRGLWYHTTGQRKGLGPVLLPKVGCQGPWYVVGKDRSRNIIYCTNHYDDAVFASTRSRIPVESVHWLSGRPPPVCSTSGRDAELHLAMKLRHGPTLVPGTLTLTDATTGWVQLPEKDHGLAAGQFVVFYDPNSTECYGCAVMSEQNWEMDRPSLTMREENTTTTSVTVLV